MGIMLYETFRVVKKYRKCPYIFVLLHDETDNKILECARAANADLIVTGDKHLLSLKEFSGIGITRVAGFLYTLEAK
jgi:predicted nucleic acid-binding protein